MMFGTVGRSGLIATSTTTAVPPGTGVSGGGAWLMIVPGVKVRSSISTGDKMSDEPSRLARASGSVWPKRSGTSTESGRLRTVVGGAETGGEVNSRAGIEECAAVMISRQICAG